MNIGIDIDNVLFPWADVANEVLVKAFGIEDPGPHTTWLHLKDTVDPEHWKWLWSHNGQQTVFQQIARTCPKIDVFNRLLKNPDNRVHFVTHRDPRYTATYTAQFLSRHFYLHPWAGLHIIQSSVEKRQLADWDVFIDDKPETVNDFLANTGALVLYPLRPWNEELDETDALGYDDPSEAVDYIEEWANTGLISR